MVAPEEEKKKKTGPPIYTGELYGVWKTRFVEYAEGQGWSHLLQEDVEGVVVAQRRLARAKLMDLDTEDLSLEEQTILNEENRKYYLTGAGRRELTKAMVVAEERVREQERKLYACLNDAIGEGVNNIKRRREDATDINVKIEEGGAHEKACSSKQLWENVRNACEDKSIDYRNQLKKKFNSTTLGEKTVMELFNVLWNLTEELKCVGEKFTSADLVAKLLDNGTEWPEEYQGTCDTLAAQRNPELEHVLQTLKTKEAKIKEADTGTERAKQSKEIIAVGEASGHRISRGGSSYRGGRGSYRGRQRGFGQEQERSRLLTCWTCNKVGHRSFECPESVVSEVDVEIAKLTKQLQIADLKAKLASHNESNGKAYIGVDSCCSTTMVPETLELSNVTDLKRTVNIETAEQGRRITASTKGTLEIDTTCNGESSQLTFDNVLVVPALEEGLLSVRSIVQDGYSVVFGPQEQGVYSHVAIQGSKVADIEVVDNIYKMPITQPNPIARQAVGKDRTLDYTLLHERVGHLGASNMRLLETCATSFHVDWSSQPADCAGCLAGRQTRLPFIQSDEKVRVEYLPGEKVHMDFRGPFRVAAKGGKKRCSLQLVDEAS